MRADFSNDSLGVCLEKLPRAEGVFYDLRHQTIFEVLVEMYDAKTPIDLITVQQKLKDRGQLDSIGGVEYLGALQDGVPSAANLGYYLEIVREKQLLRKMIVTCTDAVGRAYDYEGELDSLLDEVERDVLRISEERVEKTSRSMKSLVHDAIGTIEKYHQGQGMLTGIPTGFSDLDKMTSGLHGGEMIVLAARPSMGKTSLAMNIVEHVVLEEKLPVGVFSLEMTAESLVLRMLCSRARVNLQSIRDGFLAERDFRGSPGRRARWLARRCSLMTLRDSRSCNCAPKPGACPNSMASSSL